MTFGPHTVTVLSRGDSSTRDRQNNPLVTVLDTFTLEGCFLQQRDTDETLTSRESVETRWVLFAPPPPQPVTHIDHFQVDAAALGLEPDTPSATVATFEQDGHPDVLHHLNGDQHHLELLLRRVQL